MRIKHETMHTKAMTPMLSLSGGKLVCSKCLLFRRLEGREMCSNIVIIKSQQAFIDAFQYSFKTI